MWETIFADAEILRLTRGPPQKKRILICYPVLTTNPYQNLLYSQASQYGYVVVPTPDLVTLKALGNVQNVILHIHWLGAILRDASDEDDASRRINEFGQLLDELCSKGVRIVWTIHNVLPHGTKFVEHEVKVRRVLLDYVAAVHVMNKQTRLLAYPSYDISQKEEFYVPHPSYEGWYPRVDSQETSRLALGISSSSRVFLCFGAILPYKSLIFVIAAFRQAFDREEDAVLIIAGPAPDRKFLSQLLRAAEFDARIIIEPARVAEYDVQHYFNSADFVVAANLDLLNSGVIALATTFCVPVIARASPARGTSIAGGLGIEVSQISIDHLRCAFKKAMRLERSQYDFSKLLRAMKPNKVSRMFFERMSNMMEK
ncbi:glycosyltransferase [Bordetella petrii]|uniref:glycosyltransferase n=1 Tax=Bordetella petrii TaxID=94624 RepID=UPI001E517D5D|nr:glycosyltransferase [Bordetella petrii]MCD0501724.1 glycosyltransferase [Bordetella petrii]